MFELFFGIFWLLITGCCSIPLFIEGGPTGIEKLFVGLFLSVFWIVGFYVLSMGIKKISKNNKTKKHGIKTYGIISRIYPNGNTMNGRRGYDCEAYIIDETGKINVCSETIGFGTPTYHIGDYLEIQYYQGDMNILNKVPQEKIPISAMNKLNNQNIKKALNREINDVKTPDVPDIHSKEDFVKFMGQLRDYKQKVDDYSENQPVHAEILTRDGVDYIRADLYDGEETEYAMIDGVRYIKIQ